MVAMILHCVGIKCSVPVCLLYTLLHLFLGPLTPPSSAEEFASKLQKMLKLNCYNMVAYTLWYYNSG